MASAFGDLVIKLGLNTVEFRDGLTRAEYLTAQFSTAAAARIAAVSTLAVQATNTALSAVSNAITALPDTVRDTVARLDGLGESATRLGVSAEFLQAFNYQLQLAGSSGEAGEKGIQKFQQQLIKAQSVADDSTKAIRTLLGDVRKFGSDTEGALGAALDRLANIDNTALRNTLSRELFGKAGVGVAAAFDEGADSIRKAREELEAFGAIASNDFVAQAGALQDNLDKLKVAGTSLGLAVTEAVTPALLALTAEFVEAKKGPSELREQIRGLAAQGDTVLAFAQAVISGVARVGDVLVLGAKGFATIADAVKLAVKDLQTFGLVVFEVAKIGGNLLTASFSDLPGLIGRSVQQIKTLVAERNAVVARANLELSERFAAGSATVVTDLVNRTINPIIDGARNRLAAGNLPAVPRRRTQEDPESFFGKAPSAGPKDPLDNEIRALEKQAAQLQFTSQQFDKYRGNAQAAAAAGIDFELAVGKFSDAVRAADNLPTLGTKERERILAARDAILQFGLAIEQQKVGGAIRDRISVIEAETDAVRKGVVEREKAVELEKLRKVGVSSSAAEFIKLEDELTQALRRRERERGLIQAEEFARGNADQVAAIRLETQAIGLNEAALRDLTEARRLELEVRNATRNADGTPKVEPEVEQAFIRTAQEARRALDAANRDRIEVERSARTGVQTFARDYIEANTNAARQAQSILGSVATGLEDQIVKVFRDGRLDVRAFFDTIALEAQKLIAKNIVADVFKALKLDRTGSGGGALDGTSIFGAVGGLFSGAAAAFQSAKPVQTDAADNLQGGTAAGTLSAVTTALRAIVGLFGGSFATGGFQQGGTWAIVGEQGPELAFAPAGGQQIMPLEPAAQRGGAGGAPVYQTLNFAVQGSLDRRSEQQVAAAAYRGAQTASRRNN